MDSYCRENGFDKWFKTSVKDNSNIDIALEYLISEVRHLFLSKLIFFFQIIKRANDARDRDDEIKLSEAVSNNGSWSDCCGLQS